jgi:hypothetical protein
MLRLFKWETINFWRQYYWAVIGFVAVLLLALIPSSGSGILNSVLITLCMLLGAFFFMAYLVLAVMVSIDWLRKDSVLLELSLPQPLWKQLLSKLVLAGLINLLACALTMQLMLIFARYSGGALKLISLNELGGMPELVLLITLVDMTLLCSYLIAKSFSFSRGAAAIISGVLSTGILTIVMLVSFLVMSLTHVLVLPVINNNGLLTINGNLNVTSSLGAVVVMALTFVIEFGLSSLLLRYRFQRD